MRCAWPDTGSLAEYHTPSRGIGEKPAPTRASCVATGPVTTSGHGKRRSPMRKVFAIVAVSALLAAACGGDNQPSSPTRPSPVAAPAPTPPPPPQPPPPPDPTPPPPPPSPPAPTPQPTSQHVEALNVRRVESSTSFWRVNGTIKNQTGRTINRLSEVRIDVFNVSGILIHEDNDLLGEDVANGQQTTFSILIRKRDVEQASYYTLEVTNWIDAEDVVQRCSGCGRRSW